MTSLANDPFLAAARGEPSAHTPVWFMRQAGRSLPEYRALRGEGSILEAIKNPELAGEFTMQPVRRHNVDAAVLYSDIVVPAHAVGFGIDVAPGTGPVAALPIRSSADLARLRPLHHEDIEYVTDTVHALVKELTVPLLAFAGAPFTVASYLIEGKPSRTYQNTKRLMREDEVLWHNIMEHLVQHSFEFISAQITAGAEAFQLFDSWAGALSRPDYDRYVKPHTTEVFTQLAQRHPGVLGIHFGIGCDHLLESMNSVGNAVIGLDWRTSIRDARTRLGADTVVQGNLDPALVLAGSQIALTGAKAVLADNGGHPGHIFNLGHGVQPDTDPSVLTDVVAYVHDATKK